MPYLRKKLNLWFASYYVPNELLPESVREPAKPKTRLFENARDAGYPNTKLGAGQLETRRKREIAAGTFTYHGAGEHTASTWLAEWCSSRDTRNNDLDRRSVELHFLPFRQFGERKLSHFRPTDLTEWGRDAKLRVAKGEIGGKTIANVYGIVHTMFSDAVRAELIISTPCVLRRSDLPPRNSAKGPRYESAEIEQLVWNDALP